MTTPQNIPPDPNGKKLYTVRFKAHYVLNRNYPRLLADSEEDAVAIAEKQFWRDTQGWGIGKLELSSVRLQNES